MYTYIYIYIPACPSSSPGTSSRGLPLAAGESLEGTGGRAQLGLRCDWLNVINHPWEWCLHTTYKNGWRFGTFLFNHILGIIIPID